MKSAYELAMERLEKSAPTVQLTDAQKAQIAEIDSTYKARIAEKELFLQGKIKEAGLSGTFEELEKLRETARDRPPPFAGRLRGEESKSSALRSESNFDAQKKRVPPEGRSGESDSFCQPILRA